uniref:Uncharacterized protein n=1 Tax=Vannella robusta TaxID=1487602 RepID=A0A7S4IMK3_9EUKA|mmetsp:Transcript_5174/g.6301  ORF Transcript_5174/g.6301 Transcript_5174/m.6301 type:complete len:101 (+) Transcript_5174:138-440(+)
MKSSILFFVLAMILLAVSAADPNKPKKEPEHDFMRKFDPMYLDEDVKDKLNEFEGFHLTETERYFIDLGVPNFSSSLEDIQSAVDNMIRKLDAYSAAYIA